MRKSKLSYMIIGLLTLSMLAAGCLSKGGGKNLSTLPSPWKTEDIGKPAAAGSADFSSDKGVFTVKGAGSDIGGTNDQFRYVYQPRSGDAAIIVNLAGMEKTNGAAKAGIMIRESLDVDSRFATLMETPSNGYQFQYRTDSGGSAQGTMMPVSHPTWLKLERVGNELKGSISNNGLNWYEMSKTTLPMGNKIYIGLAVTSNDAASTNTATFEQVKVGKNGDITPPTSPTNVTVTRKTIESVELSWAEASDDTAVTGYEIFKDGVSDGSTKETSYKVTGLKANTSYSLTVKAKDGANNLSEASSPLRMTTAATQDTQSPTAPTGLSDSGRTATTVSLVWTASTDNVGIAEYEVFNNGSSAGKTKDTTFKVSGLTANTKYSFTVKAIDWAGNASAASKDWSVTTNTSVSDEMPYTLAVVADGLTIPWAIAFAPDGRIFFTERNGRLRVMIDGKLRTEPVMTFGDPFLHYGEGGLLGIVLDPDFANNHYMYVYHTYKDENAQVKNRVVRLFEKDNTATIDKTLIDNLPGAIYHNGGRIKIGPDGKLYFSDGNYMKTPDTLQYFGGKIFRMNLDGSIPKDNPFGADSPIYSRGHRNPQGLAWQPGTNRLFESEHGESAKDEINFIKPGANYGWPQYEGDNQNKSGITPPLIHSGTARWAPSGITFVTKGPWAGNLLVTNLKGKQLIRMAIGEKDGQPTIQEKDLKYLFQNKYGRLREVIEAPDGSIYFTTSNRDDNGDKSPDKIIRLVLN